MKCCIVMARVACGRPRMIVSSMIRSVGLKAATPSSRAATLARSSAAVRPHPVRISPSWARSGRTTRSIAKPSAGRASGGPAMSPASTGPDQACGPLLGVTRRRRRQGRLRDVFNRLTRAPHSCLGHEPTRRGAAARHWLGDSGTCERRGRANVLTCRAQIPRSTPEATTTPRTRIRTEPSLRHQACHWPLIVILCFYVGARGCPTLLRRDGRPCERPTGERATPVDRRRHGKVGSPRCDGEMSVRWGPSNTDLRFPIGCTGNPSNRGTSARCHVRPPCGARPRVRDLAGSEDRVLPVVGTQVHMRTRVLVRCSRPR
jgi:hypothetical protein